MAHLLSKLTNIGNHALVRNVWSLFLGISGAQIISIAIAPILTRIFSPAEFGVYAFFIAISVIPGGASSMRFEFALVLSKNNKEAYRLFILGCIFISFWLLLTFLSVIIAQYFFHDQPSLQGLSKHIYAIPIMVFFIGFLQIVDGWLNKMSAYKKMAWLASMQALITGFLSIFLGFISINSNGLILAAILGHLAVAFIGFAMIKQNLFMNFYSLKLNEIKTTFKKFIDFPMFSAPGSIIGLLSTQSFFIFAGIIYGAKVLGILYLLNRIVGIPAATISTSIGKVLFKYISGYHPKDSLKILSIATFILLIISLTIFMALFVILFFYMELILGNQWGDAKNYLIYFILSGAMSFIYGPMSYMWSYFSKQRNEFVWQSVTLLTSMLVYIYCLIFNSSAHEFLMIFTIKQCLLFITAIAIIFIISKKNQVKEIDLQNT